MDLDDVMSLLQQTLRLDVPLDADTPLLSSGLIDSLGVVVVVTELEARYGVKIDEADIGVERFDTPAQILDYLSSRTRTG